MTAAAPLASPPPRAELFAVAAANANARAAVSAAPPLCCAHCGTAAEAADLAVRAPDDRSPWYCCAGCRTVAEALSQGGLTEWYALAGDERAPAHTTSRSYQELDDEAFTREHVDVAGDGLAHTRLYLEDLRCTACVWLVERLPTLQPGVVEARVDLGRGLADLTYDAKAVRLSDIGRALDRLGHPAHPYRDVDRDAQRRREDRSLLIKIGVAGAAAGNIMLLAIALYAGWFGGAMEASEISFLRWVSMLVALPALAFAASPFFRTALASLRARRLHLDLPIAVGIVAGLGWGTANVLRGVGEIYFDSVGMLVFLLLIARFVQTRHQRKASVAAEMLLALTPRRARLVIEGGAATDGAAATTVDVPASAIAIGQLIELYPGETLPLDGTLESGTTAIDRGLLTGESRPVEVHPGEALFAGTVNLSAPVRVRATATGEDTRLAQLVSRVAELARRRAPIERFVDGIAGRFTLAVSFAALATALGWALAGHPAAGLEHAMALLVVTCPCALALATPLAVSLALSRAARRGILIKGADVLEQLARPGTLIVDKTGTLTVGAQRVTSWHTAGFEEETAIALTAALEARSTHPVAQALRSYAPAAAAPALQVSELRETFGRGIEGTVAGTVAGTIAGTIASAGAHHVAVGTPRWITSLATVPPQIHALVAACRERGESPVVIAVDHFAVAVAGLSDPLRPDAASSLAAIRALGWRVELLSGDDAASVRRAGQALALPEAACHGGVLPEDKAAFVERQVSLRDEEREGPVVMVGDGINDAAALAAATCGVAMHGSAEASIEAADIYASRPGVGNLLAILHFARATMTTIRRNLRISLFYNLTAATLAITGVINPLVAAVMMPLSSLTILVSSLASLRSLGRAPQDKP